MNSRRAQHVLLSMPSTLWATDITTEDGKGGLFLLVKGKYPGGSTQEEQRVIRSYDPWHQYRRPSNGLEATHQMFANAKRDYALQCFVERFGPVVAGDYTEVEDERRAVQSWSELRKEHLIYRSAWQLLAAQGESPQRLRDLVKNIVDGTSDWPRQYAREVNQRISKQWGEIGWRFSQSNWVFLHGLLCSLEILCGPRRGDKLQQFIEVPHTAPDIARLVLCELINAFPTTLTTWGDNVVELPASNLLFGVRPALYAILRSELLGNCAIRFCKDETCGRLFAMTHGRQQYCNRNCERRHRQRKYWASRGPVVRRQRLARKRSKKSLKRM